MSKITPLLKEYLEYKSQYPDFFIFYQVGDFYEVFFDDAKKVSDLLHIALTARDKSSPNAVAMCGVPSHSLENYVSKLLDQGHSVVVVSQTPSNKGPVTRFVDKILTPGIRLDSSDDSDNSSVLGAVVCRDNEIEFCFSSVVSGKVFVKSRCDIYEFLSLSSGIQLKELIFSSEDKYFESLLKSNLHDVKVVARHDKIASALKIFFDYLKSLGFTILEDRWEIIQITSEPFIDGISLRNLDILNLNNATQSLFQIFDHTVTSMGKAELKSRFLSPFTNLDQIQKSHDDIQHVLDNFSFYDKVRSMLKPTSNLSKLVAKIQTQKITVPELRYFRTAIKSLIDLCELINEFPNAINTLCDLGSNKSLFRSIFEIVKPLKPEFLETDSSTIFETGYFADLDQLIQLKSQLDSTLQAIEQVERAKTGIQNLKVKITQNFGIVIEITNSQKKFVPDWYIRRQTLVNCERYTTKELIDLETRLKTLDQEILNLTEKYLNEIKMLLKPYATDLSKVLHLIGDLDVIINFAKVSREYELTKPILTNSRILNIKGGFHPILKARNGSEYQPNDFVLLNEKNQFILTGPNMGGKSSFLRQIGLTIFINQIGCFVPAEKAELGIFEKIRTRIGSDDSIFKGISTFMAECLDVSAILKAASPNSVILIDELGRGTNAREGLAFCVAVIRNLQKSKTPFILATHFHELKEFFPDLCFIQTEITETDTGPVFTHRIINGLTSSSYSLFVAKMAGISDEILTDASKILADLLTSQKIATNSRLEDEIRIVSILSDEEKNIIEMLKNLDPNNLTPLEALKILFSFKTRLKQRQSFYV
ncbi:MAG: hypothetical protein NZO16_02910 [Deltaproteobacteria bacterium]|nr:hypothetical protein [Deltaproteobacteria bacterium]